MEENKYIRKWIVIATLISFCILAISVIGYKGVERMIIHREEKNITSLAKISAQSLASTLESKQQLLYAAFSGDMEDYSDIKLRLLKLMEQGEYISKKKIEQESDWKKNLGKEVFSHPGEVISGPVRLENEKYYLYIAKAVSMNGRLCGCVLVKLDLDEIYEKEEALSGLEIEEGRYCLIKNSDGKTVMPSRSGQRDISITAKWENRCAIKWVYETRKGIPKRIKKIIAHEPINVGGEKFFLYIIDNYEKIVLPIERVAFAFTIFSICLLVIVTAFVCQLIKQHKNEMELVRELQHERTLNEVMKKQEGLMQKYNHSKTMTVLTGEIAHEFNNLMTPIVLYTELLEENDIIQKEMPDEIEELKATAVRCGELARQLLDYSRQGRAEKLLIDYDATYAVEEAINIVRKLLPKYIQLYECITKTSYYVHGQTGAMNQIVLNLCTNAIHAMKEGGTLTIRFGKSVENDRDVRLIIEDTGQGIPEEISQRVFQPFFTTKPHGEGTGIGLTVVKRLVEEHGGCVHVKSKQGKGTVFVIDFPIVSNRKDINNY